MLKEAARSKQRDRLALATWSTATSARINTQFQLRTDAVQRAVPGVNVVAAVGWAVAQGLREFPVVNRRVAIWSIRQNQSVRVSFAVDLDSDVQIAVVDDANQLTPRQFQKALIESVQTARKGRSPLAHAMKLVGRMPVVLSRSVLRIWSALSVGVGIPLLGFGAAPFGAALVSSVGSFDIAAVSPPFVPFSRCCVVISVGAARSASLIRDGTVEIGEVVDIWVTADHRVCDGAQFVAFTKYVLSRLCDEPGDATSIANVI